MEGNRIWKGSGWMRRGQVRLKKIRQWIQEKGFEKWLKRDNLIILVLSGVLLFIIALPMEGRKDPGQTETDHVPLDSMESKSTESHSVGWDPIGPGSAGEAESYGQSHIVVTDEDRYLAYQEQRLTEVLSHVAGVGRVQVMITLKSSREMVVERETPVSRSSTNEADSQGGSRVISQMETGDSVVYRSEGTDSEPYVIKTLTPEIEGVLVVAEGAGNGTVNRTVTAIVQALFDVEAHKVSVVKMAE